MIRSHIHDAALPHGAEYISPVSRARTRACRCLRRKQCLQPKQERADATEEILPRHFAHHSRQTEKVFSSVHLYHFIIETSRYRRDCPRWFKLSLLEGAPGAYFSKGC